MTDPVRLARLRVLRAADNFLSGKIETADAAREIDRFRLLVDPNEDDEDLLAFARIAAEPASLNATVEADASERAAAIVRRYGRPA